MGRNYERLQKERSRPPSIEILDDEPVIDLVDEVSGGPADGDLSDLEKNLLTLDRSFARGLNRGRDTPRTFPELPDLDDLNGFDFEEEDAELPSLRHPPAGGQQKQPLPDTAEPELDWLLDEVAFAPAADPARGTGEMDNDVTEISEFDEQFLDAEEVIDGPPAAEVESDDVNDDETLELLDLDDDDIDNELVWFDDIDKPPAHGAVAQAGQAAVARSRTGRSPALFGRSQLPTPPQRIC